MTQIGPTLDWRLAVALAALLLLAVAVAAADRMPTATSSAVAVVRAALQLALVAIAIRLALEHVWSALVFASVMWSVATFTSAGRIEARANWPWVAVTLAAGVAPVLAIIFGTGSTPVSPPAIVAISGIVIGGTMTACSLAARRAFSTLRAQRGQIEAALALGLTRQFAIRLAIDPERPEALFPVLDQTRTVGLVTLPGAFIGVLLGGGSTADAAAAQVLVLVGLIAAETIAVVVATRLVASGRLLPRDIRQVLPAA